MPPALAVVVVGSTLIFISEVDGAHPAFAEVMVHRRVVLSPMVSPATAEAGSFNDDAAPVPERVDQVPVSLGLGVLAANVPNTTLQRFCAGPAAAIVVVESTLMVTSLVVAGQPADAEVMVHLSTVVNPTVSPVTAELGSFADDADPEPENVVQVPVSLGLGVFAASVEEVTLQRS